VNSGPYYYNAAGDPSTGIDRSGTDYFGMLAFDRTTPGRSAVIVARSLPSATGLFVNRIPVALDQQAATSGIFDDKDSLAVDNVLGSPSSGSIYSAFTQFVPGSSPIVAAFSRSQGATFATPVLVSKPGGAALCPFDAGACADDQASTIGVGPKGIVYIAYENFDTVTVQDQILIAACFDGGATFGAPAKVSDDYDIANPYGTFRVNSFPNLAVNPVTGELYVAWADQRSGSPEIDISTSTAGIHGPWSKPITVRPPLLGGFRFFPAVAVSAATGDVYVSYYDNIAHPGTDAYDYDYRRFGANLKPQTPPVRVSKTTITPAVSFSDTFFGDYTGAAATARGAQVIWTGTSTGKQDIETAAVR